MGDWTDVPDVVVPMGAAGYIGWALLGLAGIAVMIIAAGLSDLIGNFALLVGGLGVLMFAPAAFHYFRTVEMGWHLPNLAVWAALVVLAILAAVAAHALKDHYEVYAPGSSGIPLAGVLLGTLLAAGLDTANERLAHIPLSWAGAFGLVALLVMGVFVLINDKR